MIIVTSEGGLQPERTSEHLESTPRPEPDRTPPPERCSLAGRLQLAGAMIAHFSGRGSMNNEPPCLLDCEFQTYDAALRLMHEQIAGIGPLENS